MKHSSMFHIYFFMSAPIPTSITEQQIREFQFLYYKHYQIKLTYEDARERALEFLQFMSIIIHNTPEFLNKNEAIE